MPHKVSARRFVGCLAAASASTCSSADVLYVGSAIPDGGSQPEAGTRPDEDGSPDDRAQGDRVTPADDAAPPTEAGPSFDAVCTPMVTFQNLDPEGGGKVFTDSVKSPTAFIQTLTRKVCRTLYRLPPEVPPIPVISLTIEPLDPALEGLALHQTVTLGSQYLVRFAASHTSDETTFELAGLTIHLLSYLYELPRSTPYAVSSGMSDFVRFRTGYLAESDRRKGGSWTDGGQTAGFFFDYVDERSPNFVYRLNLAAARAYDVSLFETLTGAGVDSLWADYQGSL